MARITDLTINVTAVIDTEAFDRLIDRMGRENVTVLNRPAPAPDVVSAPALVAAAAVAVGSTRRVSRRSLLAPWTIRSGSR